MKKNIFLIVCVCCIQFVNAQDKFKFGEVPKDLLEMTVYDKDSTASAFVVYEKKDVFYGWNNAQEDFELISEYVVRIKILTADGVEHADGIIPFYKGSTSSSSQNITSLTGWTYNLEDGKIVKEKLSKDYVFTEDVTENFKRMKFALPSAKAGSVIEYKYTLKSPFIYHPENFQFQRSIPVQYSGFKISIPEYFQFNRETKGYERIKVNIKPVSMSFIMQGGRVLTCMGEEISSETVDLPALKDENYVWNYNDFMAGISFELRKIVITGVRYTDYAQTWDKVVGGLMNYDYFGKKLSNKGLFKEELAAIKASEGNDEDKLREILNLVRSEVKWNDRETLYINNPSKALKEGVGNSGEINSLLFNAVKNAGYEPGVVVMSLRSNGRIPRYPGSDGFNYFIVQVKAGDKTYYMDATRSYCDLNVIPVECLVDQALCIYDKTFNWVNLTKIGNNTSRINLIVSFNEDGVLSGKKSKILTGEYVFSFRETYEKAKNESEYIQDVETDNDISITNYTITEKKAVLVEAYDFTSNTIRIEDEDLLTIHPLLFEGMSSNPLKQEERKLPVEFKYPSDDRININIIIPKGYALDEVPKSERFVYGDNNSIDFSYAVQANENSVQIAYRLKLDTCIVPVTEYEDLRDFFSKVYAKCQEVLVFKKV
ncbi:MAG: DUF3857 domain-containing protein [Dysgonamonadaceae bacterium]|jgi:hypothetical protein|nr:DUF3857 domain-containing protein [Dysgonamonadaceae bacterium]